MDGDEYGKIDAMKLQATTGTILGCIINANQSDTGRTDEHHDTENSLDKTQRLNLEPLNIASEQEPANHEEIPQYKNALTTDKS